MNAVVLMALADVGPIGDEDAAVGSVEQFDAAEPGIRGLEPVPDAPAYIASPVPLEPFDIHALPVEIERKEAAAVLVGPVVAEVDHAAGMGVPAPEVIGRAASVARLVPLLARVPVIVVGRLRQQ